MGNVVIADGNADVGTDKAGAVYLFDTTTGDLIRTFANPSPAYDDLFGFAVAAFGETVLVGAPNDDTGAVDAGAAYLFDGTTGDLLRTFLNPTPESGDQFGHAVAITDDFVVITADSDNTSAPGAGAVYVFNASTGELLHTLVGPTKQDAHRFGVRISAMGASLLVGDDLLDT